MAKFHPDEKFFDDLANAVKGITELINSFKKSDGAITSIAEQHAKSSGAPAEQLDAHVFMHKNALKKAIAEREKQNRPPEYGQVGNTGPNGWGEAMPKGMVPASMQQTSGAPTNPMAAPAGEQSTLGPPPPRMA